MDNAEAAKMLLSGATLAAQPCPYCGGVRVIKDGDAFCTGCDSGPSEGPKPSHVPTESLDEQIQALAGQLASEGDAAKRAALASAIGELASKAESLRKTS